MRKTDIPMKTKCITLVWLLMLHAAVASAQAWFVDGYHGGIYGHYPVAWYTRFMSDMLLKYPEWRIGLEIEPETWDTVRVRTPESYAMFRKLAQGRQVEFNNPTYAQPYLYNISGESVIRQFDYGLRKIKEHFPDAVCTTYAAEEPCFTSCLPQLLPLFGFRYASLKCPDTCWGGYTVPMANGLVWLTSADGSRIKAVPRYGCEALQPNSTWQTTAWSNSKMYLDACLDAGVNNPVGMCFQDAGWKNGPWIGHGDNIRGGSQYVRWTDYIENVAGSETPSLWKFSQEDVCPGLMWGSQVLQRIARQVRHTENLLVQAEKVAAMARMQTGFLPDQAVLDEAWRRLMLAQHHDSWIVPYNGLNRRGTWADNIALWTSSADSMALSVIREAERHSQSSQPEGSSGALRLTNTTALTRTEIIETQLNDGSEVAFEATVPPFGYAVVPLKNINKAEVKKDVKVERGLCTMENDQYRIVFDLNRGGAVVSLVAKDDKSEYAATTDTLAFGELRGFFANDNCFKSSTQSKAAATVLADNSLLKRVRIDGHVDGVDFHKTITLRRGQRLIDCSLDIDWTANVPIGDHRQRKKDDKSVSYYDTRQMLTLWFPAVMKEGRVFKDAPFDVCESRLQNTFFNRWDSIKHNVVLHWIDLCGSEGKSLALLSDHTTSYSYGDGMPLGLTVQYSGPGLWWRDYPLTTSSHLRYALVPHQGKWDEACVAEECDRWNEPILSDCVAGQDTAQVSFVSIDKNGYSLSAVLPTQNGMQLRLYNQSGDEGEHVVRLWRKAKRVAETDLQGNVLKLMETADGAFSVSMPRFAVRTYDIEFE